MKRLDIWKRLVALASLLAGPLGRVRTAWEHPLTTKSLYWLSVGTLVSVFVPYLVEWFDFNTAMLTDPDLQTDDARTVLFPFHAYAGEGALEGDRLAKEMLSMVPIGVRVLYRVIVPFSGIFIAAKIVQGLAFALVGVAGLLLARSRSGGLGAGLLLVFFVLHDWFAVDRIAGGLPRAFGFPCFALWLAGALGQNRPARWVATLIAALTYPSVMNMLLAAEGLLTVRGFARSRWHITWFRLRRYLLLVGLCFIAVLPSVIGDDDRGPIHTLEQAQKEPAFARKGRLRVLPFPEPTGAFSKALIDQLRVRGGTPFKDLREAYRKNEETWAMALLVGMLLVPLLGVGRKARLPLVFFAGAVIMYLLARLLAFQLYSPERYYSFGARMATITLLVSAPAQMWFWLRKRRRDTLKNFGAAAIILLAWGATGDGQSRPSGMYLNASKNRELFEFIATLPKDVRFAAHPLDGDGIPLFSARAYTGGFETLQPWFVDSWHRQKKLAEATLRALYATDRTTVLRYAKENGVTHLLLNRYRYGSSYAKKAGSFEPLSGYARALLRGVSRRNLVLTDPPRKAIIYETSRWKVVEIKKLAAAWAD